MIALDLPMSLQHQSREGDADKFLGVHRGSKIVWTIWLGPNGEMTGFHYQDSRRLNAERGDKKRDSFLNYREPYIDLIAPGMSIWAQFENSDGSTRGAPKEDCYQIVAPPGTPLRFNIFNSSGEWIWAHVQPGCGYSFESRGLTWGRSQNSFGVRFRQGSAPLYLWVEGWKSHQYEVRLDVLSSQEIAAWDEEVRQAQYAKQQREQQKSQSSGVLGTFVAGAIVAAAGGDVRSVPITGKISMADTLDQANAALEQRNAEQRARIQAQIAAAQQQGGADPSASLQPPANPPREQPSQPAQPAGRMVPIRFYYTVGLVPGPNNTRNPMCYSNVVTLSEQVDVSGFGAPGRAAPFVDPYRAAFLERCSREGRISGTPAAMIDQVTSGWPYPNWHSEDRQVTLP